MDAEPVAIIKAAMALSRSPLNTTKVFCSLPGKGCWEISSSGTTFPACPFLINASILSPFFSTFSNWLPVFSHQDLMSLTKPGSVAETSRRSPFFSFFIISKTCTMGPGHCKPQASIFTLLTGASLSGSTVERADAILASYPVVFSSTCPATINFFSSNTGL